MTHSPIHSNEKPKALMCWSGGKDSAMALYKAQESFEVVTLMTTLNAEFGRISMHGVREELLDAQADAIGLPLIKVWVRAGSNEEYEQQMTDGLEKAKDQVVTHVIFGDIFLKDLREYRERKLEKVDLTAADLGATNVTLDQDGNHVILVHANQNITGKINAIGKRNDADTTYALTVKAMGNAPIAVIVNTGRSGGRTYCEL